MDLEALRARMREGSFMVTGHCLKRMMERGIGLMDVERAILYGEILEDYPNDYPYPSCLILGNGLHVVAGLGDGALWLITAYRPDPERWEDDGRTRRES